MSLPTASSVSSPGGKGAETRWLYLPFSGYSVESGQGTESTASRTRADSDFGFFGFFVFFFDDVFDLFFVVSAAVAVAAAVFLLSFAISLFPFSFLSFDSDEAG